MSKSREIETVKEYFIKQLVSYLTNTTFTPWCIGFFSVSGTIGIRRAKRALHLFNNASDDGIIFLAAVLLNDTNAKNLKTVFETDVKMIEALNELNKNTGFNDASSQKARQIFTDFLNVVNYPSAKFSKRMNEIIQHFAFSDTADSNSLLSKKIKEVSQSMYDEVNKISLNVHHLR